MINSITNIRPVGPGRVSFDVEAGITGGDEPIVLLLDGKRISFRVGMEPNEMRRVTVRHDEPNVNRLMIGAPESQLEVTIPHFDPDGYGMQFKAPTPKDIVYCADCGEWHEQDKKC